MIGDWIKMLGIFFLFILFSFKWSLQMFLAKIINELFSGTFIVLILLTDFVGKIMPVTCWETKASFPLLNEIN